MRFTVKHKETPLHKTSFLGSFLYCIGFLFILVIVFMVGYIVGNGLTEMFLQ
jgi:hypothetical protein